MKVIPGLRRLRRLGGGKREAIGHSCVAASFIPARRDAEREKAGVEAGQTGFDGGEIFQVMVEDFPELGPTPIRRPAAGLKAGAG